MSYGYYYMQRTVPRFGLACAAAALLTAFPAAQSADHARYWPMWRGPPGLGTAPTAHPPLQWSAAGNIRLKAEITGRGHSSPLVWGGRVYVPTAVPVGGP